VSENVYAEIPLERIREPAHQLRERINPDALGQLADSIAAEGLHQPIGVRGPDADGMWEIVWGHRRFLACRLLARPTITARCFPLAFDPLLAAVSENLNREDLNPIEEALAVRAFIERGHSRADIARLFRRSYSWVEQRVALLELPDDLQQAIRERDLPISVAAQLKDIDHEPYRKQLVYEAVTHGATGAVAAVWRQHYLTDRERVVRNTVTVEEFLRERAHYVLKYPCDWCDEEKPYPETRTVRLCLTCADQLDAAKHAPASG
jgi:ParB/RepB/Spo0J family partition protein